MPPIQGEWYKVTTSVVDYKDRLNVKLIAEIVKLGYLPASSTNWIHPIGHLEQYGQDVVSIAEKQPSLPPRKRLFGLIKVESRRRIIATIWLQNSRRRARPNHWVVEISGRQYAKETTRLVRALSKKFGASVRIEVQSDAPVYEARASDYDT